MINEAVRRHDGESFKYTVDIGCDVHLGIRSKTWIRLCSDFAQQIDNQVKDHILITIGTKLKQKNMPIWTYDCFVELIEEIKEKNSENYTEDEFNDLALTIEYLCKNKFALLDLNSLFPLIVFNRELTYVIHME